jgi:hypothetical protein
MRSATKRVAFESQHDAQARCLSVAGEPVLKGETPDHDCHAAILDFERVLGAHPSRSFDERAPYGRASCRPTLGDRAAANADFDAYLTRDPQGRECRLRRVPHA